MDDFIPAVAAIALIVKVIDFLRYARAGDTNGMFTQLCVWLAGVAVVLLLAQTAWASEINIGDIALSSLGFWSQVFYGLSIGSLGSTFKDGLKAIDNSNSTAIPTLLPARGAAHTTDTVRRDIG